MKYYIIAGEASGDLHAANLMKELKLLDPGAQFRCWGGDMMEAQGGTIVKHYKDLAFMGFLEVALNLRTILNNISFCKKDILQWEPDVVILVDYPGFNLRIAKFLKEHSIRTYYYISPQVWAWKEGRVKGIKQTVDRMFVILPFEGEFYKKWEYKVDFVGHPLLDAIAARQPNVNFRKDNGIPEEKPIISLLPGSRKQEIAKMLPQMLSVVPSYPNHTFVIAGLSHLGNEFYQQFIQQANVKLVINQTYDLLENAHAALVTSGTATLETALFNVPEVVCYKGSWLSYIIGKQLVKVKYISLVNLIADRPIVKELIQNDLTTANLKQDLDLLLDTTNRNRMLEDYKLLRENLGGPGASKRTAELMMSYLKA